MKYCLWMLFLINFLFFKTTASFAESGYVLPYPPQMPGSFMYKLRLASEEIQKYWYFGDFGQFTYSLKQADKYLVEAKTLFEYKQYLLGIQALKKSDTYFTNTFSWMIKAKKKHKDIVQKQKVLKSATLKHIELLNQLKLNVPETFVWRPEKLSPTVLNLKKAIDESIPVRNKYL